MAWPDYYGKVEGVVVCLVKVRLRYVILIWSYKKVRFVLMGP